jgi:hypothetical protein
MAMHRQPLQRQAKMNIRKFTPDRVVAGDSPAKGSTHSPKK